MKDTHLKDMQKIHLLCFDNIEDSCFYIDNNVDIKDKLWVNLTNGVEIFDYLDYSRNIGFCRITSTNLERKKWNETLASVPDEMILMFATGAEQYIVDFGANKSCPRAMYQGMPMVIRILSKYWDIQTQRTMYIFNRNGKNVAVSYDCECNMMRIDDKQKSRLKYFKKYLSDDVAHNGIKLNIICASTQNDGNYDMHTNIVKNIFK